MQEQTQPNVDSAKISEIFTDNVKCITDLADEISKQNGLVVSVQNTELSFVVNTVDQSISISIETRDTLCIFGGFTVLRSLTGGLDEISSTVQIQLMEVFSILVDKREVLIMFSKEILGPKRWYSIGTVNNGSEISTEVGEQTAQSKTVLLQKS